MLMLIVAVVIGSVRAVGNQANQSFQGTSADISEAVGTNS
jgi:hypothetical protein